MRVCRFFSLVFSALTVSASSGFAQTGAFIPNDPDFRLQWGLYNVGSSPSGKSAAVRADIAAPFAWPIHWGSSSVTVAIVGRGVNSHPQFADRLLDGRAFVDDPFDTRDSCPNDTHLAGIIGAATNDGAGVAGINGRVRLLPVRVFSGCSGTSRATADGIRWAADQGADIILAAVQFYNTEDLLLCDAVAYAAGRGALVIAPVGHIAAHEVAIPGRCSEAIAVASTNALDEPSALSNFGPEVDLSAPGEDIWSTWIGGGYSYLPENRDTHAAAAFVAGVASLVMSYAPQLPAGQAAQVLFDSADDLGEPGWDESFGHGRVNAASALGRTPLPVLRFNRLESPPTLLPPLTASSFLVRIANGTQELLPNSARIWRRSNFGTFASFPLTLMSGDVYRVDLPAVPCATVFQYYLAATGHAGTLITDPPNAPFSVVTAQVAFDSFIFVDDFEKDQGWTVEGGTNTSGRWERVIPVGTAAQPEYDASRDDGHACFITGQHRIVGDGSNDVDDGPVVLTSPIIPLNALTAVIGYWRWFYTSVPEGPDRLTVEISRDGGTNWRVVEEVGHKGAWESAVIRLADFPDLIGNELQLRFSTSDIGAPSLVEAAIDDVRVRAISCTALVGDPSGDGRIDEADAAFWPACLAGPGRHVEGDRCGRLDLNHDYRVDLRDTSAFQRIFETP